MVAVSLQLLALLIAGATAAPVPRAAQQCAASGAANEALGAVYFLSNGDRMNHVVASLVNADGTLSFATQTATGGKGASGVIDPPAKHHPDSLFSQHSVIVAGNAVFAVNAGSDTVSMFKIDPQDPSKLTLAAVEPSGGQFPVALAATSDASTVCALNSAGKGTVRCFASDGNGLTPMAGSDIKDLGVNQTNPPQGPLGTVSDLLFQNDQNLVVSIKGTSPQAPGNLASFATKKSGNSLAIADPTKPTILQAKGGVAPFGMSAGIDDPSTLFVTDAGFGVSTFADTQSSNAKAQSSVTKINGQVATCWSAQSKVTKSFFSTDIGTSQITEFQVTGAQSKQVRAYGLDKGNTTDVEVASTKNGDFLYSLLPGTTAIGALAVGTKPGTAKLIQNVDFSSNVAGLTAGMIGMATFVKK